MIEVKGLTKYYGNKLGVQDISFTIHKGETVGLLGPNGAGKSTIMKMLACFMYPTAGTIMINRIDALTNTSEAVRHIGFMPENPPLYLDMDVRSYLDFIAVIKGVDSKVRATQIDEIMELTSIKNVEERLIKNLSKGYRQRVGLAMALINFPEVLILDEPTIGLDPKQINEVRNLIENLSKKHTIIISSHILSEVAMICKKIIIISNGKIVLDDSIENIEEGGKNLIIRVKGQTEKVLKILSGIQEISKTKKIISNMEADREYCRFLVTGDGTMALREKIFQRLSESNLPLVELSSIGNSLEDRFINITS